MASRAYNYINFHRESPNECENLVLMCVDFRFRKGISDLLPYAGFREFDLLNLPGASQAVIKDDTRPFVLQTLRLVVDLHKVKRVIIVDHEDCAACGGSAAFADSSEEEAFHTNSLREAAGILRKELPEIDVTTFYAGWWQMKPIG